MRVVLPLPSPGLDLTQAADAVGGLLPRLGRVIERLPRVLLPSKRLLQVQIEVIQILGGAAQGQVSEGVLRELEQDRHKLGPIGFFHLVVLKPRPAEDVQGANSSDGVQAHGGASEPLDEAVGRLGSFAVS